LVIRAVLFDLDGTLFNRDATVAGILKWQVREFSSLIAPARAAEFIERVTMLDEHGHRDKREVYAIVATEFGFERALTDRLVASFRSEYPRHCTLEPTVADTLVELRRRGIRLAIVTNGTAAVQNAAIDALGIRNAMDAILISETEGVRKPQPEIFERAARTVGVLPRDCCFVGDHPTVDIEGAKAAGLSVLWKRTPYWEARRPVQTIDDVSEVLHFVPPLPKAHSRQTP
jgi:putative hydrolase of the HAD superfamily